MQTAYNRFFSDVRTTTDNAMATVVQTTKETGQAIQQWTVENKEGLLASAEAMQVVGDNTSNAGLVMAAAGAAVAGVGAAPGGVVTASGQALSLTGAGLEVVVEVVAGSTKNAAIKTTTEAAFGVLGIVGEKTVNQMMPLKVPGLSSEIRAVTKYMMGSLENMLKTETEKNLERFKDDTEKEKP